MPPKLTDHEAKFTKIVEDKPTDHEIRLNKMVEDINLKHNNLLASQSDATESKFTKFTEDINLKLADHCRQVETNLDCLSSDNSTSPPISANLLHKDVTHAVSSVLNEEKEKVKGN